MHFLLYSELARVSNAPRNFTIAAVRSFETMDTFRSRIESAPSFLPFGDRGKFSCSRRKLREMPYITAENFGFRVGGNEIESLENWRFPRSEMEDIDLKIFANEHQIAR